MRSRDSARQILPRQLTAARAQRPPPSHDALDHDDEEQHRSDDAVFGQDGEVHRMRDASPHVVAARRFLLVLVKEVVVLIVGWANAEDRVIQKHPPRDLPQVQALVPGVVFVVDVEIVLTSVQYLAGARVASARAMTSTSDIESDLRGDRTDSMSSTAASPMSPPRDIVDGGRENENPERAEQDRCGARSPSPLPAARTHTGWPCSSPWRSRSRRRGRSRCRTRGG